MIALGQVIQRPNAQAILRALACAIVFGIVYIALVALPAGQRVDAGSFGDFAAVNGVLGKAAGLCRIVVPVLLSAAAVVFGVLALVRSRVGDVLRAVVVVVFSVAASEGLKYALPRPDPGTYGYAQNTFPSGHVAWALSTALAVSILAPPRSRRIVVAIAVVASLGVAWGSVASYAHRPSDVVGGALVVGFVGSLALWGRTLLLDRMPVLALVLLCGAVWAVVLVAAGAAVQFTASSSHMAVPGSTLSFVGWSMLFASAVFVVGGLVPVESAPVAVVTTVSE